MLFLVLALAACQQAAPPLAVPATTEEPGFTRFCHDNPGRGTCP